MNVTKVGDPFRFRSHLLRLAGEIFQRGRVNSSWGGNGSREGSVFFSFLFFLGGGMGSLRETTTEKTCEIHFFQET